MPFFRGSGPRPDCGAVPLEPTLIDKEQHLRHRNYSGGNHFVIAIVQHPNQQTSKTLIPELSHKTYLPINPTKLPNPHSLVPSFQIMISCREAKRQSPALANSKPPHPTSTTATRRVQLSSSTNLPTDLLTRHSIASQPCLSCLRSSSRKTFLPAAWLGVVGDQLSRSVS